MTHLSRRSFVKSGGALVVAVALPGRARAGVDPFASGGPPDLQQVDSYLAVHADNTASVMTGRVEVGQGTTTGLLVLVAEELDMDIAQLTFVRHDTDVTPYTGGTLGSSSVALAGPRLRSAAATAKQALLGLAAPALGVPVEALTVAGGVVSGGGRRATYGDLIGDRRFGVPLAATGLNQGQAPAKPPGAYRLVGGSGIPRVDIPAKVTGSYVYVHGVRVPGMLHGRVIRPRGQGAYGDGTATGIVSVDEGSIRGIGDARIVRRGDFLGVVVSHEYDAIQAATSLKVVYADPPAMAGSGNIWGQMRAFDSAGRAPARTQLVTGDVDAALAGAARTVSATYAYRYQGHMPIGPSCAVADVTAGGAVVLANPQDAYRLRDRLAGILGLPAPRVRVQYWEGASTFGASPSRFDTPEAAAVMSQLAGAPVRLQFMRWDEHGWDNYSPPLLADVRGAVDPHGRIVAFDYAVLAVPEMAMESVATSQHVGIPLMPPGLGSANTVCSGSQYDIPNRRVTAKSLPLWDTYFKTSALRGPLTPQTCFASEQLVDELAHASQLDPLEFRLRNISTQQENGGFNQWRDALVGAGRLAGWRPRVAASKLSPARVVHGRGIALGGFAGSQVAVVADVTVDRHTGKVTARHLYAAHVAGLTVYPDGVLGQLEGNLVMGASRALTEEVAFTRFRTTSLDWSTYPILRFRDSPAVTCTVVQRPDLAATGAGEPAQAPVPAAIANAFFDATGIRIREAPLTPGRVRAVLASAQRK